MTRRPGRLRAAVGGVVAATVLALAPGGTSTAVAASRDAVTLTPSTSRVDDGRPVTLSGAVRLGGRKAARVKVRVLAATGSRWRTLRTVRTDAAGRYRHAVRPRTSTRFRVETVRSSKVPLRRSPTRLVRVRPATTISLAASAVDRGRPGTVRGTVRSAGHAVAGVSVTIEAWRSGRWTRQTTARTDRRGAFVQRVTPTTTTSYRARTGATARRAAGTSKAAQLAVRPVLTDLSPTAGSYAVSGMTKTVTGRVVGGAGRAVRVEHRPVGGSWTPAASGHTDADGRFELALRPQGHGRQELRVVVPAGGGLAQQVGPVLPLTTTPDVAGLIARRPACLGAAALERPGCANPALAGLVLPTQDAAGLEADVGWTADSCFGFDPFSPLPEPGPVGSDALCPAAGSPDPAAPRIALVGDSHAVPYRPALAEAAAQEGWRLDSYVGLLCRWMADGGRTYAGQPFGPAVDGGPANGLDWDRDSRCWTGRAEPLTRRLASGEYDAIVVTGFRNVRGDDPADRAARYAAVWREALAVGTQVLVVPDNGDYPWTTLGCVTMAPASRALGCTVPRSVTHAGADPLVEAARLAPGARLSTVDRFFCGPTTCPVVVGNVVVHRDTHHVSATYAATVVPYLMAELRRLVDR